jgi:DNA-binding GntR family transcriptional regulator
MSGVDFRPQATRIYDATGQPYARQGLPPSFPEHIRQVLEREIIEDRLGAGARVAEDELSRRLGVSRTPIREALRMLEGQALIVRRRGRGSTVAARTSPEQARAIYEVRFALEGHLAACAAANISDDELALVERLRDEFEQHAAPGRSAELVGIDSDLHWAIYNSADSDLISLVAAYWGRLQRELYGRAYDADGSLDAYASQHDAIVAVLAAHDAAAAQAAMVVHLKSGWERVRSSYALAGGGSPGESDGA